MAQWLGQFSGHTHATRVEDAEALLRHAVEVLGTAASSLDREKKAKTVKRLAERLMMARLKLMKARLAEAKDVQSGVALARRAGEIASLEQKYTMMQEGGLDAILREFGAIDGPVA